MIKENVFEVKNLTVAYREMPVLWNVDLEIPKGKIVAVIGPNGAGKTTLLRASLGILPKVSGEIKFFGQKYEKVRKKIAYVPQKESVDWDFPATVFDVVMMGRYGKIKFLRRLGELDRKKVEKALEQVGMADYAKRHISELSGGQKQRVFLARAIVQEAELYFLDEPFAGVDVATEKAIAEILKEWAREGKTVVVVHHDLNTVTEYFDWILLLNIKVLASGPMKEIFSKENLGLLYGHGLPFIENLKFEQ